jgi:hypothetical protein
MKRIRAERVFLAAAVFACGELGSVEWSKSDGASPSLIREGVVISVSTARAGEASRPVGRASCSLVRYYVAKYSAYAAETWARSKGATDAEIQTARQCITPPRTLLSSYGYTR